MRDKALLVATAATVAGMPAWRVLARPDRRAADALRRRGFSDRALDTFFRPFFSGVFLEDELVTSSRFLDLMLRMFVRGRSVVPAGGMGKIPQQLADGLRVALGTPAEAVAPGVVRIGGGAVAARAVVVACDATAAAHLLPTVQDVPWRSVTTIYHAAPADPLGEPTLLLDGDRRSPVVNTVVMTAAAPSYGPGDGRALVATSLLGLPGVDERAVRLRLAELYRTSTWGWEHLRTYDLPHALPAMTAPHPFRRPVRVGAGVYVCGDHRDTSSIQGAMVSGRRAADAVLADV